MSLPWSLLRLRLLSPHPALLSDEPSATGHSRLAANAPEAGQNAYGRTQRTTAGSDAREGNYQQHTSLIRLEGQTYLCRPRWRQHQLQLQVLAQIRLRSHSINYSLTQSTPIQTRAFHQIRQPHFSQLRSNTRLVDLPLSFHFTTRQRHLRPPRSTFLPRSTRPRQSPASKQRQACLLAVVPIRNSPAVTMSRLTPLSPVRHRRRPRSPRPGCTT